jgi:hypothetical protein
VATVVPLGPEQAMTVKLRMIETVRGKSLIFTITPSLKDSQSMRLYAKYATEANPQIEIAPKAEKD